MKTPEKSLGQIAEDAYLQLGVCSREDCWTHVAAAVEQAVLQRQAASGEGSDQTMVTVKSAFVLGLAALTSVMNDDKEQTLVDRWGAWCIEQAETIPVALKPEQIIDFAINYFSGAQSAQPTAPESAEPDEFTAGVNASAAMLDKMADDYASEHSAQDMDTGVWEFGRAGEDHYNNLRELADSIRSIVHGNSAPSQPAALPDFQCWDLDLLSGVMNPSEDGEGEWLSKDDVQAAWPQPAALPVSIEDKARTNLIECLREHASFKCIEGNEKRMVLQAAEMLAAAGSKT